MNYSFLTFNNSSLTDHNTIRCYMFFMYECAYMYVKGGPRFALPCTMTFMVSCASPSNLSLNQSYNSNEVWYFSHGAS
jgi:hypothetical protein